MSPRSSDILVKNLRFTQDITSCSCAVPVVLLREYQKLNLNETELITLIRLIYLRQSREILTLPGIAEEFSCSMEEALVILQPFFAKSLIDDYDNDGTYQCDGLFRQLYELWMDFQRAKSKAGYKKVEKTEKQKIAVQSSIYHSFEREMGRSLTFKENQQIREWLDKENINEELVDEALRRAVLQGVMQGTSPLAYIDKILLNWQKQKLTSLEAVMALDKQPVRPNRANGSSTKAVTAKKSGDDYSEVYK